MSKRTALLIRFQMVQDSTIGLKHIIYGCDHRCTFFSVVTMLRGSFLHRFFACDQSKHKNCLTSGHNRKFCAADCLTSGHNRNFCAANRLASGHNRNFCAADRLASGHNRKFRATKPCIHRSITLRNRPFDPVPSNPLIILGNNFPDVIRLLSKVPP